MDRIPIPEEQAVPIDSIAQGIRGLRIVFVNIFAVTHPDNSWTLIDTALPFSSSLIKRWVEKSLKTPPNAIVLTHGHFDHVGAAQDLADEWNVPIYAHPLEAPYLTGEKEYPAPNAAAGGGAMSLLAPLLPLGPVNLGDRLRHLPISDLAELPEMPGWQIVPTPGHTPGHVAFFRPEDRCLVVGDAFCTTKPESVFEAMIAQTPELHGPPAHFTENWDAARASVERMAALEPAIVAAAHGQPLRSPSLAEELRRLAERFDTVAVPDNKKQPAA